MFKDIKKTTSKERRCENYFLPINRVYKKRPSRNSGVEKYNNWNKQFTRGAQQQIWTARIISKLEDRSTEITQSEGQKEKQTKENE